MMIYAGSGQDVVGDELVLGRLHLLSGVLSSSVVQAVLARLPPSVSSEAAAALREAWTAGLALEDGPAFPSDGRRQRPTEHRGLRLEGSLAPPSRGLSLLGGRPATLMERPPLIGSAERPAGGRDPDLVYVRRTPGEKVFRADFRTEDPPPPPPAAVLGPRIVQCNAAPLLGCPVLVLRPDGSVSEARISLIHAGGRRVTLRTALAEELRVDWPETSLCTRTDDGLLEQVAEERAEDSVSVDDELLQSLDLELGSDSDLGPPEDALSEDSLPEGDLAESRDPEQVRVVPLDREDRERYLSSLARRRFRLEVPPPTDSAAQLEVDPPPPESVVIARCRKVRVIVFCYFCSRLNR